MTRDDKAKIIDNAHLARNEAREDLRVLDAKAQSYVKILKGVIHALENHQLCEHEDGQLRFAKPQSGALYFGEFARYPTAIQINEVLGEMQGHEKKWLVPARRWGKPDA